MNQDKYVFTQLVEFLNNDKFRRVVTKYSGDRYVKHFTCWNQLLVMMFGQLTNRESLRANQNRDCRIFEEFAYFLVAEARSKRITDIFKLGGSVYAFDSTTIDLCLSVFWWAKFRKHKGGIKIHTLYDIETQVPAFFHITEASVNDVRAMDELTYEPGAYYIFDRGYNDFCRLYRIVCTESRFVVRAKKNLQYRAVRWRRHINNPTLSGCKSRSVGYLSRLYPSRVGDTQQ